MNMIGSSKVVFILNGRAGSGKDTFVDLQKDYALREYMIKVSGISTVDKVKEAARILGWNGIKDSRSRKFLSDLKDLSVEYCDSPAHYCYQRVNYMQDNEWLYIHCREPIEIEKLRNHISNTTKCYTVFIRRYASLDVTSNHADTDVENYNYDFEIDNNSDLSAFATKAYQFVDHIVETLKGGSN